MRVVNGKQDMIKKAGRRKGTIKSNKANNKIANLETWDFSFILVH